MKQTDKASRMGEEKISRLLRKFAMPAIAAVLINSLYNVVDRIYLGNSVGPDGIAATVIAFPVMMAMMAFGMLISQGGGVLISIRLGEKNKDAASKILGNSTAVLLMIAVTFTICGLIFIDPLLRLFGASENVMPMARDYLSVVLLGAIVQYISFGLNNIIRAQGDAWTAMMTMIIAAGLNIILDPIFIFGFGWGVRGAAWATVLSQTVSSVWILLYFNSSRSLIRLRIRHMRVKLSLILSITAIGFAPFSMHFAGSVMNTILNRQLLKYGGDIAISTMGIVFSMIMLIIMPVIGLAQAGNPIIGFNYGAKNFHRVRQTLGIAIAAATVFTITGFLAIMLFPHQIISAFNNGDENLAVLGPHAIRVATLMLPLVGFQIISSNYFQAVGKVKAAAVLGLSRQVLLLIPLVIILPHFFGLEGVWMALPAADFGASLLSGTLLLIELRKLNGKF